MILQKSGCFNKVKKETEPKNTQGKRSCRVQHTKDHHADTAGEAMHNKTMPSLWENMCAACGKTGHFRKVCRGKRDCAVHEVEIDMEPESQGEDIADCKY